MILAIVAIGLIVFTFISYYSIKRRAEDIAAKTAKETTEKIAREITDKVVNKITAELIAEKLPDIVNDYFNNRGNYSESDADDIAETINKGKENGQ